MVYIQTVGSSRVYFGILERNTEHRAPRRCDQQSRIPGFLGSEDSFLGANDFDRRQLRWDQSVVLSTENHR